MPKPNNNFQPFALWLTGLSASGKTTLAKALFTALNGNGEKIHHLDGDEVRSASGHIFDFTPQGRDKNIQAAIELAKNYQIKGFSVIASFISPYKRHRQWAREALSGFVEIYVQAPLSVCEARDPKGLYQRARAGEIDFFTGISDVYEEPDEPDILVKTNEVSVKECVEQVLDYLREKGYIG